MTRAWARAAVLNASHSWYSRPKLGAHTAVSSGGQVALVNTSRRQLRWLAMVSRAGNHIAACESPNTATVATGCAEPYVQVPTAVAVKLARQPSRKGRAALASSSGQ